MRNSQNALKESIVGHNHQNKLNFQSLMKLIDDEIFETQERLKFLRQELISINKVKEQTPVCDDVSIENSLVLNVSQDKTVRFEEPNVQTEKHPNLHLMKCSDCLSDNLKVSDKKVELNEHHFNDQIENLKSQIASLKSLLINHTNQPNSSSNREQKYLEKVSQLKNKSNYHLNTEDITNNIASIIYEKLQNRLPISKKSNKVLRSVAIGTSNESEQDVDVNASLFSFFEKTLYMDLPEIVRKQEKQILQNLPIIPKQPLSIESCNSQQKSFDDKALQISLANSSALSNEESYLSIPNISNYNYSQFKTLIDIPSNSSTPKRQTTNKQISKSLFENIKNNSNMENSINSSYHSSLSPLTSIELSNIDRDAFWKDIFTSTGFNINKNL